MSPATLTPAQARKPRLLFCSWCLGDGQLDAPNRVLNIDESSRLAPSAMNRERMMDGRPGSAPSRSDSVLVTSFTYDDAGNLLDTTDPRALVTRDYYDALGRVTKTITDYTGGTLSASNDLTTEYTYDGSDHVLTVAVDLPSSAVEKSQYVYGVTTTGGSTINSNDILAKIEHPDPSTGLPSTSYQETFTVDALGETLIHTDQNSHATSYGYNVLGQDSTVTNVPLSQTTTMAYDVRGNLASVTDPLSPFPKCVSF